MPTDQREKLVLAPLARGHLGDDLLRQHVERPVRDRETIEFAATHAVEERRALDEFVARSGNRRPLGVPSTA